MLAYVLTQEEITPHRSDNAKVSSYHLGDPELGGKVA